MAGRARARSRMASPDRSSKRKFHLLRPNRRSQHIRSGVRAIKFPAQRFLADGSGDFLDRFMQRCRHYLALRELLTLDIRRMIKKTEWTRSWKA